MGAGGGGEGNKEQKSLKVLQPVSTLLLKFLMILEFVFNLKRLNFNFMFSFLCYCVNFMRLRPVQKVFAEFLKKKVAQENLHFEC